jgi:uncharacterized protein YdeI (BOF family)
MQLCSRNLAAQGLLCLIAFAFTPTTQAEATKPSLIQSPALVLAGPQASQDKPDASQPDKQANKAVVVTGTIAKNGSSFVLRDSSGTVYELDAQDKAQPYEGKSVKITGKLEAQSNLLHVEAIEELKA